MAMMAPATRARLEPTRVAPLLGTVVAEVVAAAVVFAGSSDFLVVVISAGLEEAVVRVVMMVAFRLRLWLETTGVVVVPELATELAAELEAAEVLTAELETAAEEAEAEPVAEVAEAVEAETDKVPVPEYSNRDE